MTDLQYYRNILRLLERYFANKDWKNLFLTGGCYWLADTLHQGINGSVIMINRIEEHCALFFGNGLYDVRGRIPKTDFHAAAEQEIQFMKKNYRPKFDAEKLNQYLAHALAAEM